MFANRLLRSTIKCSDKGRRYDLHTVRPAPPPVMRLGGLLFDGLEAGRVGRKKAIHRELTYRS